MDKQEQILAQLEKMNNEIASWKTVFGQTKLLLEQSQSHEERIKAVEKSRIPIAAASAVVGGLLSHVLKIIF